MGISFYIVYENRGRIKIFLHTTSFKLYVAFNIF
jgi:hypothetical protein